MDAHAAAEVGEVEFAEQLGEGLEVAAGNYPVGLASGIQVELGTSSC